MHTLGCEKVNPYKAVLELAVLIEIDTVSMTLQTVFPTAVLDKPRFQICTYMYASKYILGLISVQVRYNEYVPIPLHVVERNGPSLVGRDWLR